MSTFPYYKVETLKFWPVENPCALLQDTCHKHDWLNLSIHMCCNQSQGYTATTLQSPTLSSMALPCAQQMFEETKLCAFLFYPKPPGLCSFFFSLTIFELWPEDSLIKTENPINWAVKRQPGFYYDSWTKMRFYYLDRIWLRAYFVGSEYAEQDNLIHLTHLRAMSNEAVTFCKHFTEYFIGTVMLNKQASSEDKNM